MGMAESYDAGDDHLIDYSYEDDGADETESYIIEFQDVDEAIAFAEGQWPDQKLDAIESMLMIQAEELEEGDAWLCMIGVCDICGEEEVNFLPAVVFEDEITGIECFNCGNMSLYPKEVEVGDDEG